MPGHKGNWYDICNAPGPGKAHFQRWRFDLPNGDTNPHVIHTPPGLPPPHTTNLGWYHSKNTTKAYSNYVKAGKKWLKEFVQQSTTNETGAPGVDNANQLAGAFDSISDQTPLALKLYTAFKCEEGQLGFSTAEGARTAFKDYFTRVLGCQGDTWKFDSHTQTWEGNPVFDPEYKEYFESLKNRGRRNQTVTHALPMLLKDMRYQAFATTAFNLWTRNEELVNLQWKNMSFEHAPDQGPYIQFTLVFRKTNKDALKGHPMHVPPDHEGHPEIDAYLYMSKWIDHLTAILQCPLQDEDYIFPALASTDKLKLGEPMSCSGMENLLDQVHSGSGVMEGRNGKFTTHCFRRGGAQWCFMFAEHKWSMKAVKWWGGWSSSDDVGTVMRYLLDELIAYEEGFSDIMMKDRNRERHESFMGEGHRTPTPATSVTHDDLAHLATTFKSQMGDFATMLTTKVEEILTMLRTDRTFSYSPGPVLPPLSRPAFDLGRIEEENEDIFGKDQTDGGNVQTPFQPAENQGPICYFPQVLTPSRIPITRTIQDRLVNYF
ncbi:hypothetical protein BV25DRAFT_1919893 [Artomyces pyxidatus]|uniref:Uncharacterized protein n=1 Tax=Artomyces pyxidatus TaxID=48021 RepID=A0ACB8SMU8_9AGAM|nr:hypothetical protein BV25DRAFT_1919893 [Artomyces pyxidatus]